MTEKQEKNMRVGEKIEDETNRHAWSPTATAVTKYTNNRQHLKDKAHRVCVRERQRTREREDGSVYDCLS